MAPFEPRTDSPLDVERGVERVRINRVLGKRQAPGSLKNTKVPIAALRAWSVTGGQRADLIQEEQLRPPARAHHAAVTPAKF
jgi:hypothetical protein